MVSNWDGRYFKRAGASHRDTPAQRACGTFLAACAARYLQCLDIIFQRLSLRLQRWLQVVCGACCPGACQGARLIAILQGMSLQ